jgi:DNA-binding LacI/PurR family transcriptional regulator
MAAEAVRLLSRVLVEEQTSHSRVALTPGLVVRESTGGATPA